MKPIGSNHRRLALLAALIVAAASPRALADANESPVDAIARQLVAREHAIVVSRDAVEGNESELRLPSGPKVFIGQTHRQMEMSFDLDTVPESSGRTDSAITRIAAYATGRSAKAVRELARNCLARARTFWARREVMSYDALDFRCEVSSNNGVRALRLTFLWKGPA